MANRSKFPAGEPVPRPGYPLVWESCKEPSGSWVKSVFPDGVHCPAPAKSSGRNEAVFLIDAVVTSPAAPPATQLSGWFHRYCQPGFSVPVVAKSFW
jgi:hypothetical protein